jgi:hypothetical protein
MCPILARQVLIGCFLLGDRQLNWVLTWPSAGSDSSGGASFGKGPTLLVNASKSKFHANKQKKKERAKHDLRKAWNDPRKAWNDPITRPLALVAEAQCFQKNPICPQVPFGLFAFCFCHCCSAGH